MYKYKIEKQQKRERNEREKRKADILYFLK